MSRAARRAMVRRPDPELSLSRQCRLLSIGRSWLYYTPQGESAETLARMRRIDELFLKHPFYGARQIVRHLRREGVRIGRRRAGRLMRLMGLQAIYRAPRTSEPHPEHRVYPYLLKGLAIERANHVWCADITYIPVRRGFLYLVAILDWASRYVLAWRLSNTLDAGFCVEALEEARTRHGQPEIFNTDQGSQFTGFAFTGRLRAAGVQISMDGRGRCMDNIFIERLWRSLKYEAVYLHDLADGFQARRVIGEWIDFYNAERPHSGHIPLSPSPFAICTRTLLCEVLHRPFEITDLIIHIEWALFHLRVCRLPAASPPHCRWSGAAQDSSRRSLRPTNPLSSWTVFMGERCR